MLVGNNESTTTTNVSKSLAISIAMQMWQYNAGGITQWSTSRSPSVKCLRRIAPAAAMVNKFE
jgi:hypothetical protein